MEVTEEVVASAELLIRKPAAQVFQAFLAQCRSDPSVAMAEANLDVNLAAVTAAWEDALPPDGS
jgi:FMN phosphatase YigB (HAD superfamily)